MIKLITGVPGHGMSLRTSPPVVKAMSDLAAIIKRKGSCSLNDLVLPLECNAAPKVAQGAAGLSLRGTCRAQREAHPVGNTGSTSVKAQTLPEFTD